ncbi:hypothetical protein ACOMHN_064932 [Nucella lapillus]
MATWTSRMEAGVIGTVQCPQTTPRASRQGHARGVARPSRAPGAGRTHRWQGEIGDNVFHDLLREPIVHAKDLFPANDLCRLIARPVWLCCTPIILT